MTPQTALAGEPSAITPIIVKSGGDTGTDMFGVPSNVSIDSSDIAFAETVPGATWSSSQSTLTGRITALKIRDGDLPPLDVPVAASSQLASVSFKIGHAHLMAMESGIPAENNVLLLLASPEVPFNVAQNGNWNSSATFFRDNIKSATLMVGDEERFFYEFQNDDVEVKIYFH